MLQDMGGKGMRKECYMDADETLKVCYKDVSRDVKDTLKCMSSKAMLKGC